MKYRILLLIRINARNQIELNPARIRYNFFLVENNNFVTVVYRLLKSVARYNCGSIFNLYTPEWQPPLKNLLNKLVCYFLSSKEQLKLKIGNFHSEKRNYLYYILLYNPKLIFTMRENFNLKMKFTFEFIN